MCLTRFRGGHTREESGSVTPAPCAKTFLDISVGFAGRRPRAPARCDGYSIGSCGAALGLFASSGHRGTCDRRGRHPVADRFVDTDRRRADRGGGARSCLVTSSSSVDIYPFWSVGRRARAARTWRLVCGCASIRAQAHRDSYALITPSCESHSPRNGCRIAFRSGCLADTPSRVVDTSSPVQTAHVLSDSAIGRRT